MAKVYALDYEPDYKDPKWLEHDDEFIRKLQEVSDQALENNSVVGYLLKFPVADGYAFYQVLSEKPLELGWAHCGDAWQADPILLRGIRISDVRKMMESDRAIRKLFKENI